MRGAIRTVHVEYLQDWPTMPLEARVTNRWRWDTRTTSVCGSTGEAAGAIEWVPPPQCALRPNVLNGLRFVAACVKSNAARSRMTPIER
jgi:hypothetical protein